MTRLAQLSVLTALLLAFAPAPADACSCGRIDVPCERFWKAAAVFIGRVESIVRAPSPKPIFADRIVTFSVVEAFRGITASQAVVRTPSGGGSCGYPFKQGHEYFVDAEILEGGVLRTGICSRTAPVSDAAIDIAFARQAMSTPLGRVSGDVRLGQYALLGRPREPRAMPDVGVLIRKESVTHRAVSDGRGEFKVEGLVAGTYAVKIDLPDSYYVEMRPNEAALLDARGCAHVSAIVYPNGRAAGRVVDSAGTPLPGLTIELTLPTGIDDRFGPERLRAVSDREGRYEFSRIPEGRFIIGINTRRTESGSLEDPRVFHPGVQQLADAARVVIGSGERVSLGDFVIPAAVRYVRVTGVVVDADGALAEGARVFLMGPGDEDDILTEPVSTDAYGRFALSARAGREYRVFAERARPGDRHRLDASDRLALAPADGLKPLTLTLRRRY
jgi:hypothetical protein